MQAYECDGWNDTALRDCECYIDQFCDDEVSPVITEIYAGFCRQDAMLSYSAQYNG